MIALVPTCNRPELFALLVSRLEGFRIFGLVNNTTPDNEAKYRALSLPDNAELVFTGISGEPKSCHVKTFRMMLQYASDECLVIEDDVFPCSNFFSELKARIRVLKSACKNFTLSPIYLPGRNSDFYTGGSSRLISIGNMMFMDQAWVDGNFYMTAGILSAMKKWLADPVRVFKSSSGIGRKNSMEISRRNWKMYTTVPTMVEHLDHESVMFGPRRQEVPLIARFDRL